MIKAIISTLIIVWLSVQDATASDWLYTGELPVHTGQGEPVPVSAVLNQVLVRLTGQVGQNVVSELGLERSQIEALVLTQQFRRVAVPSVDSEFVEQRVQRIEFDKIAVNRLLDQAGLPRWGSERPNLLLWIVTDAAGSVQYLGDDPVISHAVDQAAFRYGLNLVRPILDARDRIEVSPSDVRGGFTDASASAMQRYAANGVVMLDLRDNNNFMTGRWVWQLDDLERAFERSGTGQVEVVDLGLGRIAAALGSRYAVRAGRPDVQRLVISGINDELHYAEILAYLNSLTGIESLRVIKTGPQGMEFELMASINGLESRIALSDLLEFERRNPASGALHYRLVW